MDEEVVKPCIQDRFRSIISRSRTIISSLTSICLQIILILFIIPEILNRIKGEEIINIFPEFLLLTKIEICFSLTMILILLRQNQINKSFLIFEQQRELRIQKREHDLKMYVRPINLLLKSLYDVNNILTRRDQKIELHKHLLKEQEFFHEHLKTGYQPLFKKMCDYQDSYNRIVDQVNATYQNAFDLLERKWIDEPDFNMIVPPLTSYIRQFIAHFSEEVTRRLINGTEPQISSFDPRESQTIIVGSAHITIYSLKDREKVVNDLNLILEGSEVFGKFQEIWKEVNPLREDLKQIKEEIESIRACVHAGLNLKGSCSVGKEANFE